MKEYCVDLLKRIGNFLLKEPFIKYCDEGGKYHDSEIISGNGIVAKTKCKRCGLISQISIGTY